MVKMCKFLIYSFVIVLTITVIQGKVPDEIKEIGVTLHKTCQAETGVTDDKIEAANAGNFIDDQPLKCYMKCVWEQVGAIDEDGTIDEDVMISILPPDLGKMVEASVRKCGTKVGADPCDNAFLTSKCYYENKPEGYFLV